MKFTEKQKNIMIAVVAVLVLVSIYLGFGTTPYKIKTCKSTVTKYVTAEYSETVNGIDFEGEPYMETDYWSEPASDIYTETRINELPVHPPMPKHNRRLQDGRNFDNFRFHVEKNLEVFAVNDEEPTVFNEPITKAETCIIMIDSFVEVKTWYGITYGSNFNPNI